MRKFDVPNKFRSELITKIKLERKQNDRMKRDFSPTILNYSNVTFYLSRHFGFCFGVENAIEIAYKTLNENQGKRIFLLSEMIHNPEVNKDLEENGILFIQDTYGKNLIDWEEITSEDIVIIPAFGTTIFTENILKEKGINPLQYNTTCPFVEKVWNRSREIAQNNFTTIIHGKAQHEETRATFSHTEVHGKAITILNLDEAKFLAEVILGSKSEKEFYEKFGTKISENFDVNNDLIKIGVVNQTTMLAEETLEITEYLREIMIKKFGIEKISEHFADTRDTLCYATNDNQTATKELLKSDANISIVVGGYNSSNTTHIVKILDEKMPTYFIKNESEIKSKSEVHFFDIHTKTMKVDLEFLSKYQFPKIALTAGASCPDSEIEKVINKIISFYN